MEGGKSLALIESIGLDGIIVNPNPPVGVSDGHVESQIVVEGVVVVVGGEVKLSQGGVVGINLDLVGAEDEKQDEDDDPNSDENGAEDLEDATPDAVEIPNFFWNGLRQGKDK